MSSPFEFKIPDVAGLFRGVIAAPDDVRRRLTCLSLASTVAPKGASVYDLVAVADYLDRGQLDEPQPCSCNNPEAEHPRGDSAFCSVARE